MPSLRAAALTVLVLAGCALFSAASSRAPAPVRGARATASATVAAGAFLRGVTVSCPIYGQVWGTSAFSRALEEIRGLGGTWVAIHPYARIEKSGEVRFTPPEATSYLPEAVARARDAGLQLFWKPHLAYWGRFEWRGAIDFGDDAARWSRFFASYRAFILAHARFAAAHDIPLFSVATELERAVDREASWRRIIGEVRAIYPGRLTWAANWDGVDRVPFWDALDLIGVQAYFPLDVGANDLPTRDAIARAWSAPLARLEALARATDRPVLFTEIGYPDAPHAAARPWTPGGFPGAPDLRARLIGVAARHLETVPFIAGLFWWKWMPGPRFLQGDFRMREPRMRKVLSEAWTTRPAPRPPTASP